MEIPPALPSQPPVRTTALAIWSLVLAFLGLFLCLPSLAGIICGIIALVQISRSNGALRGTGLAVSGIIASVIAAFLSMTIGTAVIAALAMRSRSEATMPEQSLAEARANFSTQLTRREQTGFPVPEPPSEQLKLVYYSSPVGQLPAYLSPIPNDGKKHPAIIWLTGGFSNSISENAWETARPENDQTARIFREMGVVTLYPSLRGGNENPGFREAYLGEVDDVLAAADYLETQPGIDRIYLGGHSTGGTLALLVVETRSRFRAVFSFGPVTSIADYGTEHIPFDATNDRELRLRQPIAWLADIQSPTYVFEGEDGRSNIDSLRELNRACKNRAVRFYPVKGHDHFSLIAPLSRQIAAQIIKDTGPTADFSFEQIGVRRGR